MQKQECTRHQDKTHHITDPRSGGQGRDLDNFIKLQMINICLFVFEEMWIMPLYLMVLI